MPLFNKISWLALKKYRQRADCLDGTALNLRNQVFQCRQLYRHIDLVAHFRRPWTKLGFSGIFSYFNMLELD